MHRLSRPQQPDNQELLPAALDWRVTRLPKSHQVFYSAGPDKRISSNENLEGWRAENSLPNAVQPFRVSGHIFRFFQCLCQLSRIRQQNLGGKMMFSSSCTSMTWWFTPKMPARVTWKLSGEFLENPRNILICQLENVSFSSRKG